MEKKMRECIYIASRLSKPNPEFHMRKGYHPTDIILSYLYNLKQSLKVASQVWKKGHYPYVPGYDILLYLELDSLKPGLPYSAGLEWVRRCDSILIVNGLDSKGVQAELNEAINSFKKIYYDIEEIKEVKKQNE